MGLISLKQKLGEAIKTGKIADLVFDHLDPSDAMAEGVVTRLSNKNNIPATLIRDILQGKHVPVDQFDPRGLKIHGARIIGRLDLENLVSSVPLELTSCHIPYGINGQSSQLSKLVLKNCVIGISQTNSKHEAVCLDNATISGQLSFEGSKLTSYSRPALGAEGLRVDGDMLLNKQFRAAASSEDGAVRLAGTKIGGQLVLTGATLDNLEGPALFADGLIVEGGMFLRGPFSADASSKDGAIRLLGATITIQLSLSGATIKNNRGPALFADMITVHGNMILSTASGDQDLRHFDASASSLEGTIRLRCAKIIGELNLIGAKVSNQNGPVLDGAGLTVASNLWIDRVAPSTTPHTSLDGAVILKGAKSESLHVSDEVVKNACKENCKWDIDGLSYTGYPTQSMRIWLRLLEKGTVNYAAQPYRQLAKAARDAGHDSDTRKVLITQRSDHLRRGNPGITDRLWGYFTNITVRYGYWSWLPAVWLVGLFTIVWYLVDKPFASGLATTQEMVKNGLDASCTWPERLQIAIDMTIPLITTGVEKTCHIIARQPQGEWLAYISIFAELISWALVTLFVAGFTGIIRKN